MRTLYVDAMNVIGSRPDGWWRDRPGAVRRLADDLQPLVTDDLEVVLVVDGRPTDTLAEGRHGRIQVRYAAEAGHTGRNAADRLILDRVAANEGSDIEVVTADRELAQAVEALGATVTGPRAFRDGLAPPT